MDQDFDQNRAGGQKPRRDGEQRSFGRRDDDRPRFSRGSGSDDASRPRFNRDSNPTDRPRFERNDERRSADRANDRGNDRPRPARRTDNTSDRPRFSDRSGDSRNNDSRSGDSRGGDSRGGDSRGGDSRGGRSYANKTDRFGNERRFNDRPDSTRTDRDSRPERFDRSDRSRDDRNTDRPRFERSRDDRPERPFPDRRNQSAGDRPRFERRNDDSRSNDRPGDRPRFDRGRDDRNTDRPRPFSDRRSRSDEGSAERPRFDRGRNDRPDRADKPAFKRVGGFNRDADERNRSFERGNDDRPRFDRSRDEDTRGNRRNDDSRSNDRDRTDGPYKFTPEQRKESGERRTGRYEKAPNYNIDQRPYERRSRRDDSEPARPSADRSAKADRTDRKAPARPVDDRSRTSEPGDPNTTRLNRYIANSGVCSRREADELISKGDITVNGKVVTEMGFRVKDGDTVKYGTKVLNPERFVYVLLNKPKDYITTTDDPEERKTVMELVADAGNFRLYPVGRLDRKTTGLLLLTNDGELADKLTHPSNNVRKIYQVEIDKPITEADFETLLKGIELEDGPIKPDSMSIITPDAQVVGIEIHSGRNRIVRRMFEHLGYEVTKLDRTTFAGLTKKELPRGKWRFLDPKEVVKLKYLN